MYIKSREHAQMTLSGVIAATERPPKASNRCDIVKELEDHQSARRRLA